MLRACIRKTGYSICIPIGALFFKVIYPYANTSAENEYRINKIVRNAKINTFPVLFSIKLFNYRILVMRNFSAFMLPLSEEYILGRESFSKMKEIFSQIAALNIGETNYWEEFFSPELKNALKHLARLNISPAPYLNILSSLSPETTIHGDLSKDNITLINGKLFIYDWQLSCIGPEGWDEAYYIATSTPFDMITSEIVKSIENKLWRIIILCAAVRLGRSIRKNKDTSTRLKLLRRWEYVLDI